MSTFLLNIRDALRERDYRYCVECQNHTDCNFYSIHFASFLCDGEKDISAIPLEYTQTATHARAAILIDKVKTITILLRATNTLERIAGIGKSIVHHGNTDAIVFHDLCRFLIDRIGREEKARIGMPAVEVFSSEVATGVDPEMHVGKVRNDL